jgi:uncharacterized protein
MNRAIPDASPLARARRRRASARGIPFGADAPKLSSALLLEGRPPCRPWIATDRTAPVPPNASKIAPRSFICAGFFLLCLLASASGALPPKPEHYVEDKAGILSPATKAALNSKLEQFERDSSDQVLVATFPDVPADYQMEDFTQRTAEAWGVGQKKTDNGAVLFLFPKSHKIRIEVGYGLEGAIPDAVAKRIIQNEIVPAFRAGDFDGGVTRAVAAILAAAKGEYHGAGRTVADNNSGTAATGSPATGIPVFLIFFFLVPFLIIVLNLARNSGACYGPTGRRISWFTDFSGGGFSGGSGGGGGGFGSSGGGFSGGGGSFGGGGASGGW